MIVGPAAEAMATAADRALKHEGKESVMFTSNEIMLLLNMLSRTVLIEPSVKFPYFISTQDRTGYSEDPKVAALQAKLSIMLEAAHVREAKR